jgi:ArpU family phage transcriptional regulator
MDGGGSRMVEQLAFMEEVPKNHDVPKSQYVPKVERALYDYPVFLAALENRDEMESMYPSLIASYEERIRGSDISKPTEKYGIMRAEKEFRVSQMKRALGVLNCKERELIERKYFNRRTSDEGVMLDMEISNTLYYKLKDQALRAVANVLNII